MKVLADICIVPMGVGTSVSEYVRALKRIFQESGLVFEMHANGTNVEGDLADLTRLIEKCEERLTEMGVERTFFSMRFSTRRDKNQSMADKMKSIAGA